MARHEHLPIFAEACRLALHVEQQVAGFARTHRFGLGEDLRTLYRQILRANSSTEKAAVLCTFPSPGTLFEQPVYAISL